MDMSSEPEARYSEPGVAVGQDSSGDTLVKAEKKSEWTWAPNRECGVPKREYGGPRFEW